MKIIVRYLLIIYYILQVKYKVYENRNYIHHIFWFPKTGSGADITYLEENSQPVGHLTTGLHDCYQGVEDSLIYIFGITLMQLKIKLKLEINWSKQHAII